MIERCRSGGASPLFQEEVSGRLGAKTLRASWLEEASLLDAFSSPPDLHISLTPSPK